MALLSAPESAKSVELDLTPQPSLEDDFNALEFELTKSATENKSTMHCTNFFKKTKDEIYQISKKSDYIIAEELKEIGAIEEVNLAKMEEKDRKMLERNAFAEKIYALQKEAALKNTEHNNFVKNWKNVQEGIFLGPTDKEERVFFNRLCFKFSRNIAGHEHFPTNVGLEVLGLGLLVDRGINLVLTEFEKVIIVVNESKVIDNIGKKNAIKAEIKKLALEARLDERLEKLKFAATLLMNDEFLSALPKEKRVPLGILGIKMANLVRTFEKPDGPYQSLRRVLDEAVKNPDKFIEWAQKVKKPGQAEQLPEQMVENNADASASQEQIEF